MVSSKSTKSPAFQFYPKDYLSSSKVQRMSNAERGIYTTLLAHCWLDNGLPTDLRALARLAGETPKVFERLWAGPLHECFAERAGKLHNERLDKERRIQAEYRKKQKENADKRWQSHGISQTHPTAMPEARQSQTHAPLPHPLPLPQSSSAKKKEKEIALDVAFREFQAAYPEHRRKGGYLLETVFVDQCHRAGGPQVLMAALANHVASAQWADPSLVPGMGIWLSEERWRQTLPEANAITSSGHNPKTAGNVGVLQRFIDRGRP